MSEPPHLPPSIKRRHLRKDVVATARFEWEGEKRSCLTNTLGEGGVYVQTLLPPPVGSKIKLEIELPDRHLIHVVAEVRHSLQNTYGSLPSGFGAQFLDLGEADRKRISELVESNEDWA